MFNWLTEIEEPPKMTMLYKIKQIFIDGKLK